MQGFQPRGDRLRHTPPELARSGAKARITLACEKPQNLDLRRQFDQLFRIAVQVMDTSRVTSGERRHVLDALPIRDRHELGLGPPILPEGLRARAFSIRGLIPASKLWASYSSATSGRVRPRHMRATVCRVPARSDSMVVSSSCEVPGTVRSYLDHDAQSGL
jgi:hypothetical protein